ncbi:phosphotransferase [Siminovitchia sp. 179-K 8D1 HS]|uniref:phosphotransferase n=1 Tax=Siminovitchia sp. 179-K 8D1 HS TaxID=3142385 RepID=UPI0039A323BE
MTWLEQGKGRDQKIEQVRKLVSDVLCVDGSSIYRVTPCGGMTNENFHVKLQSEDYIVRIPGRGTADFIDRRQEKENLEVGVQLGINPEHVYFDVASGIKITRMIPGARTLTAEDVKNEAVMKKVTALLRKLHQSPMPLKNRFDPFRLMKEYESLALKEDCAFYAGYKSVKKEVSLLAQYYKSMQINMVPCHIDALYENMIEGGDGNIYLIDWEYSGMFDPMWDIATHVLEADFSTAEEELFFRHYFKNQITPRERERILLQKIFQDFLWSIWTLFKEAKGDDFGSYGLERFERAVKNISYFHQTYREAAT